jgi:hypothetical protein
VSKKQFPYAGIRKVTLLIPLGEYFSAWFTGLILTRSGVRAFKLSTPIDRAPGIIWDGIADIFVSYGFLFNKIFYFEINKTI